MGISRVNATGEFVYKIKKWNKEYRDSVVEVQFTPRSGNSALPPYLLVPTTISWKSRMSGSPHSMTYLRHHLQSPHCILRRISNTSGTFRDLRSGKKKQILQARLISPTIQVVGWFYFARSMRKQGFSDF